MYEGISNRLQQLAPIANICICTLKFLLQSVIIARERAADIPDNINFNSNLIRSAKMLAYTYHKVSYREKFRHACQLVSKSVKRYSIKSIRIHGILLPHKRH